MLSVTKIMLRCLRQKNVISSCVKHWYWRGSVVAWIFWKHWFLKGDMTLFMKKPYNYFCSTLYKETGTFRILLRTLCELWSCNSSIKIWRTHQRYYQIIVQKNPFAPFCCLFYIVPCACHMYHISYMVLYTLHMFLCVCSLQEIRG